MIKKGLSKDIRWSATTRVDSVDKDLLQKMKEAGCDHIEFGVESGNREILKKIKKGITIEQAANAVRIAKDLKLHTEIGFILGHPDETAETAYQTIYLASMLNTNYVQLGIMVPYPGTEVADMAKNGLGGYKLLSNDWSDYNKQLGNALELKNLSRKDLERIQFAGYLKLFIFNRRYKDLLLFLLDFHREAFAFIRNYFRKGKTSNPSNVSLSLMLKMIFSTSPTLNEKGAF
ncbi:MAG: radical SAM protein [Candidatus Omnitrophota bacterium]|nr:radical SAM protein [Candidatus Omnitrophota bacterium]